MGVIRVLSEPIANKIAAGEVVERPASVVKELLENALDAGARSIRIEVEGGGRELIRVSDDGCGMVRDDALLALERHATSKLHDVAELSAIATLGFRGEALPAMASVSQFTLETAAEDGQGTRVKVRGGKLQGVEAAGLPRGTSVTVAQLFVNIPARKKFLKSDATELGHVTTLVTHYALAYPEVQIRLQSGPRTLLALPVAAMPGERLEQIFGAELRGQCVEFREAAEWASEGEAGGERPGLGLHGFASKPELQKLNRNSIFCFVNRRLVRDRLLQHAIGSAYANMLPANVHPAVLLFVDLPFGEVDVNVHPGKTEVRFRRQTLVHDAVRDGVRRALAEARPLPSFLQERAARPTASPAWQARPWSDAVAMPYSPGAEAELGISAADLPPGFELKVAPARPQEQALPLTLARGAGLGQAAARATGTGWVPETGAGCGLRVSGAREEAEDLGQLRPLGQLRASYIVAAGPASLWLVDQHAAHERVLFEQLLEQRAAGRVESQRLLLPQMVRLDPARWQGFEELAEELAAAGFEATPYGQHTLAVQAAPAGIAAEQVERLLQETLQAGAAEERGLTLEQARTRITATVACHASVKVNMVLEREKMEWLLRRLAATRYPMACPHGRPVLLRYSLSEIERAFKRTG